MNKLKYTQFGTVTVAVILPILGYAVFMSVKAINDHGPELVPLLFVSVLLLFTLLLFYKITITVDDKYLSFSMGIGLIKKSWPLSVLKSCLPVRNFPLSGFGIRHISNGWLYNVSGLSAIEISFHGRVNVVRIGTDRPYEVAEAVNARLGKDVHGSETFVSQRSSGLISISIFAGVVLIVAAILLYGSRKPEISFKDKGFSISGMYGMDMAYTDIASVDTFPELPAISMRTNGFAMRKILKGNFTFKNKSRARLFINKGYPPYLNIRTKTESVWINFENRNETIELLTKITEKKPAVQD